MSLHFITAAEENLNRYARISPAVLKAIESNRPAFMELMAKIFAETNGELITVTTLSPEEAENHQDLQGETRDEPVDPALLEKIRNMVLATYLTSFFNQELPFLESTLQHAHHNGVEDGYAYLQVKGMARN